MCYSLGVDAEGVHLAARVLVADWGMEEWGEGADENVDGADGGCKRLPRWSTSLAVCLF